MNKKLTAALSGGAVLVVALTGCTGSSGGGSKGPDPKLVAWAKTVCDAVPAQDAKIKAANASIASIATDSNLPPQSAQKTYSQAFQDLADGYQALADAIDKAGAPPGIGDGAKRQQDAAKNLVGLSTSYVNLKKKVDGLDTKDQIKFAQGLKDVAATQTDEVGKQSSNGTEALKRLEEGDVKQAMAQQPSCKVAAASVSASPTAQSTTG
ncbi:small secreted protein [Streptomyces camelliae]|uniref:Small secreted protein n=1 Tax=Streptomyces camelliae TaxID=3004093 RepID=A0ABY7P5C6_9ACTN|nr:small secreted protein [Streptomyces sp. HUAS 2-6]WBO64765.1 small secreted protein [Streptomyces sp. HUAS 2-6]